MFPVLRLVLLAVAIALTAGLYYFLSRTFLGRAVVASTLNREGALVVGINIRRIALFTFGSGWPWPPAPASSTRRSSASSRSWGSGSR